MSDYVSRQYLLDEYDRQHQGPPGGARKIIAQAPAEDVVPVVHGKWIDEDPAFAEYFANCSVCGYEIDVHNERGYFNFCPNCGAKMDGKRKE